MVTGQVPFEVAGGIQSLDLRQLGRRGRNPESEGQAVCALTAWPWAVLPLPSSELGADWFG